MTACIIMQYAQCVHRITLAAKVSTLRLGPKISIRSNRSPLNGKQRPLHSKDCASGATEEQRFLWSNVENHRNNQKEFAPRRIQWYPMNKAI